VKQFRALYLTQIRVQATRARLASLAALGAAGMFVAYILGRRVSTVNAAAEFVGLFGLAVLVPVTALVVASAGFGDTVDDGTLVYLWMRPVRRTVLAAAVVLAAVTITVPLTVLPVTLIPLMMRAPSSIIAPSFLASLLGLATYCCVFTALGLRSKRALMWGLLYVFIWEGFVAQAGGNAARLAVRAYTQSIISNSAGVTFELAQIDSPWSFVVPLAVMAVSFGYTVRRLGRHDVP